MTLKRRLQQIEAASNVVEGYQPVTAICRTIMDIRQRPCQWFIRGLGMTPEERTAHQEATIDDLVAKSGKPASSFIITRQTGSASIALLSGDP